MPVPTFHYISGTVVAGYAAVVSTATGAVQLFNYLRDRARIKLQVRHNMLMIPDSRYGGAKLTLVYVANAGRRPVTSVGAQQLHPHNSFVITETMPPLPHELTEGKNLIAVLRPSDLDFSRIDFWEAWDAVGRSHRLKVAPWHVRVWSNIKWRREWRRNAKAKKARACNSQ